MDESEVVRFVTGSLADVDAVVASEVNGAPEVAWGDTFFYYDPRGEMPADRRMPFATIVVHDYEGFDTSSDLDRPGVFRINMWVSAETFQRLLGDLGHHEEASHDFTALDTLLPHPVYAAQSWVSVLNPGPRTTDLVRTLLSEAHERAVTRYQRRSSR